MLIQLCDIPLECICLFDLKVPLMTTPSDGNLGKFMWFSFGVCPYPFFPYLFSLSSFTILPSNIVFSFLSLSDLVGLVGWDDWESSVYIHTSSCVC